MKIENYLNQSPVFAITSAFERINQEFQNQFLEKKISLYQGLLLVSLFFEEEGVLPTDLARTFRTSKSRVSHIISKLEAEKLISRNYDDQDRRKCRIQITDKGRSYSQNLIRFFDKIQNDFEDTFDEKERQTFFKGLTFLVDS